MNNQFKKLFDITYQEKTFTIFIDDNYRYTFLEKDKEGNYIYPTLEDYKVLHKIYNEQNPFLLHNVKKYSFKEKVRVGALAFAVSLSLSTSVVNAKENGEVTWEVTEEENGVTVTQKAPADKIRIDSLEDLEKFFGLSSVALEDIDKAIEQNDKLDANFKMLAHNLADAIYKQEPDADLRIYYLNLLELETESMPEEDYKEEFKDYSVGTYEVEKNKISYIEGESEETLYHELAHTVYSFYREIDGKIYCRYSNFSSALNEAMNNKTVDFVTPSHSYPNIGLVLDYLLTFVDYDFNRYNEEGASYIILDLLKYENVDAFYINSCLNAMMRSSVFSDEYIKVEESPDLLEELFNLCKNKVNKDMESVYAPFLDFSNLLSDNEELFYQYLHKYNTYLEENQIENRISEQEILDKVDIYKDIRGFCWNGEELYPYVAKNGSSATVIIEGERKEVIDENNCYFHAKNASLELIHFILKNQNMQLDSDFWKSFAIKNNYISAVYLYETTILLNGNIVAKSYISDLKMQIGLTSENRIGFKITNQQEEIVYQSEENLKNLSNAVSLEYYYPINEKNVEQLELINILNEEYLKEKPGLFQNLFIEEDELLLEPYYFLYLEMEKGGIYGIFLNQCFLVSTEENTFVSRTELGVNIELPPEEKIYLKDILNYHGLLQENQEEYHFTEQKIKELVQSYLEEMEYNKGR